MNLKETMMKLNGKKLPIGIIIAGTLAVATLQAEVANNIEDIKELKPIPIQVAQIEQKVADIDEQFTEFREDYKHDQRTLREDIKLILQKVSK